MSEIDEKTEKKFNQEHYDLLKKCSRKRDMTEWNQFFHTLPVGEIFLKDMIFPKGAYLKKVNFDGLVKSPDLNFQPHHVVLKVKSRTV